MAIAMSDVDDVDDVDQLDPSTMSIDQLDAAVARGVAEQAAYIAWWLSLVAEFHRRNGHWALGMATCAQWLTWRCGIDTRTARDHVRVADKLTTMPLVRAELAAGRLSYSKVRALTRVVDSNNEAFLVALAADLSASQLERIIKHYELAKTEALSRAEDDYRRTQCGVKRWVDSAGLVHHEIVSAPEEAGLIDAALAFGADSLFAAAKAEAKEAKDAKEAKAAKEAKEAKEAKDDVQPALPRPTKARKSLDALLFVLRRGLINADRDDLVEESRYLIMVHVREAQALLTDDGKVDMGNGLAVSPRTLRRLGCGGLMQGMLSGVDGRPLDMGHRLRLASRNQRIALKALYPTCDIPGCQVPFDWCEVHHIEWWENGGPTDMANLRPRCSFHHHLVHEGGWREVLGVDGRTVLLPPNGRPPIVQAPPFTAEAVPARSLVDFNRVCGVEPPDDLRSLGGRGMSERLTDFGYTIIMDHLFAASTPPEQVDLTDLEGAFGVDDFIHAGASPPTG